MGLLEQAKLLGGIGSILELFPFIDIIGYILVLIAVKNISDYLHNNAIFRDMIYAVITAIIGVAIGGGLLLSGVFFSPITAGLSSIAGAFGFLAIVWIVLIISAIFIRRSFYEISSRLNINYFRTAGTLYLIGAATTIILVGFIILFIAYIFQIIAFFAVQEQAQPSQATVYPVPPPPPAGTL